LCNTARTSLEKPSSDSSQKWKDICWCID
jgi:hypothetical protein